jgi:hypothetical protein
LSIGLQEKQVMLAGEAPVHESVNTAPPEVVKEVRLFLSCRPRNDGTLMNQAKV